MPVNSGRKGTPATFHLFYIYELNYVSVTKLLSGEAISHLPN